MTCFTISRRGRERIAVARISSPFLSRIAFACLLALIVCAATTQRAAAQTEQCWVPAAAAFQFGEVDPVVGAQVQTTMPFACQSASEVDVYFRVCMHISTDPSTGDTFNPRKLTNYNNGYLDFDLFYDAAHQVMITPPSGPYNDAPESWLVHIAGGTGDNGVDVEGVFPFYARIYPGQFGVPAGSYQGHPGAAELRYVLSTDPNIPPSNCETPTGVVTFNFNGIYATVTETCHVLAATDMEFGTVTDLEGGYSQTSQIRISCPTGVSWQVGLNDGNNYSTTRRMVDGTGSNFVNYELYQDTGHTIRWGNTPDTDTVSGTGISNEQTLSVYGRVEEQNATSGTYSDQITVTLTF